MGLGLFSFFSAYFENIVLIYFKKSLFITNLDSNKNPSKNVLTNFFSGSDKIVYNEFLRPKDAVKCV